jgi:hypothetical protein
MSSHTSQAIGTDLLIYQNKQLSRLVRSLRSSIKNHLQHTDAGETVPLGTDGSNELDRLRLRNRQLEARLAGFTKGMAVSKFNVDCQSTSSLMHIDSVGTNEHIKSCDKCEEYSRISTSLAIANSRLELIRTPPVGGNSDSAVDVASLEQSSWISRFSANEELYSNIRRETDLRVAEYARVCEHQVQEIRSEVGKIVSMIGEERGTEAADFTNQMKSIAPGMESAVSSRAISDSADLEPDSAVQKLREALRMKNEQLSRTLTQLINQQVLISDTEKENDKLRLQVQIGESLKIAALAEREKSVHMFEANSHRISELINEISERNKLLRFCIDALNRDGEALDNAYSSNNNLQNVVESLQFQVNEVAMKLGEAKRIRLCGSTGQSASTLVNMEIEDLKKKVKCTLCGMREKSVALTTCMHCFCRECVNQQMIAARNRKCPLCNQRFADTEVRDVHFLQS